MNLKIFIMCTCLLFLSGCNIYDTSTKDIIEYVNQEMQENLDIQEIIENSTEEDLGYEPSIVLKGDTIPDVKKVYKFPDVLGSTDKVIYIIEYVDGTFVKVTTEAGEVTYAESV